MFLTPSKHVEEVLLYRFGTSLVVGSTNPCSIAHCDHSWELRSLLQPSRLRNIIFQVDINPETWLDQGSSTGSYKRPYKAGDGGSWGLWLQRTSTLKWFVQSLFFFWGGGGGGVGLLGAGVRDSASVCKI